MNPSAGPLLTGPLPPDPDDPVITCHELTALITLATTRGARSIAVGSARTPHALATADAITRAWRACGGTVADTVTWPQTAASWLRQARRFADAPADLWVMTGPAVGWAQMTRRLLWSTTWQPGRTLATTAMARPSVLALVGAHRLTGLTGAGANGAVWTVTADGTLTITDTEVRDRQ